MRADGSYGEEILAGRQCRRPVDDLGVVSVERRLRARRLGRLAAFGVSGLWRSW